MDQLPDPCLLPIAQAAPASHSRTAAQFLGEHLPGNKSRCVARIEFPPDMPGPQNAAYRPRALPLR
jgi:hypothetical protein